MLPKLNHKRALFVLTKIDEILAWEKQKEGERDTRFVDLGRYLCEVRAGQYWRLENLRSFDEFLQRRFPDSRRTAYYLMSIHEHLPPECWGVCAIARVWRCERGIFLLPELLVCLHF